MGYDTKISSNAREQLEQFLGVFYTRFSRFGKWSAKLNLKKVLLKPSPQLEFTFSDGDG